MSALSRDADLYAQRDSRGHSSSATATLPNALTNADLADQIEQIKIVPQVMSVEEISKHLSHCSRSIDRPRLQGKRRPDRNQQSCAANLAGAAA